MELSGYTIFMRKEICHLGAFLFAKEDKIEIRENKDFS